MQTGIDLGLTTTALVTLDDNLVVLATVCFGNYKGGPQMHPVDRYSLYCGAIIDYFSKNHTTGTIVLEDPVAIWRGAATKLLELKGVYLIAIGDFFPSNKVFLPKATQIKKAFTGSGKATKPDMIEKCKEFNFVTNNEHLADAFAMAYMSAKGLL